MRKILAYTFFLLLLGPVKSFSMTYIKCYHKLPDGEIGYEFYKFNNTFFYSGVGYESEKIKDKFKIYTMNKMRIYAANERSGISIDRSSGLMTRKFFKNGYVHRAKCKQVNQKF